MHLFDLSHLKVTPFDILDIIAAGFYHLPAVQPDPGYHCSQYLYRAGVHLCALFYRGAGLKMPLLTAYCKKFANVGIIAVIVVFQQEIRRFLLLVGKMPRCSATRPGGVTFLAKRKMRKTIMPALSRSLMPAKA